QSEKLYLDALRTLDRNNEANRALALSELGDVYANEDEAFKSERAYAESLEIYKRLSDKRNTALLLRNLGTTYAFEGRNEEAMRLLKQSLKKPHCFLIAALERDRKSTRLNSSHDQISYAV